MFNYCQQFLETSTRKFFYVSHETIEGVAKDQTKRFATSKKIPGTRDFHSFRVISSNEVEARKYSLQNESKNLILKDDTSISYQVNDCVALKFGNDFNVGIIKNIIDEEILIEFYKKSKFGENYVFTSPSYKPTHAFVSSDIICKIGELLPTSKSCRAFKLTNEDRIKIQSEF